MTLKVQFTKRNKEKHVKIHIYTLVWLSVFLLCEYCNEPIHYWHMQYLLLSIYLVQVFMIKSHRNIGCQDVPLLLRRAEKDK